MMQLVGYYMWAQHPSEREISAQDVAQGVSRAQKGMIEGVLEYTSSSFLNVFANWHGRRQTESAA